MIIIGAGWHGREVAKICADLGHKVDAFLDDKVTDEVDGIPVGALDHLEEFTGESFVVAVGDNSARLRIGMTLLNAKAHLPVIIHPTAVVWSFDIGPGTVIFPFAVVSVAAKVGKLCIVNKHATVGHGADMADGCNVADACAFSGKMGAGSMMGMHAVTIPGVDIGENCVVGAGSICIKSVPDNARVAGVPAKPISSGKQT